MSKTARLRSLLHRQARRLEKKADSFTVDGEGLELKNPASGRFVDYLNSKATELRHRANGLRS